MAKITIELSEDGGFGMAMEGVNPMQAYTALSVMAESLKPIALGPMTQQMANQFRAKNPLHLPTT